MKVLRLLPVILFICGTFIAFHKPKSSPKKPNVILIIADDLGYSDLASYGNAHINTPHIDALGKEGVRFTRAYVTAPICAPSRDAILTGRYQQRFGDEYMPYEEPVSRHAAQLFY